MFLFRSVYGSNVHNLLVRSVIDPLVRERNDTKHHENNAQDCTRFHISVFPPVTQQLCWAGSYWRRIGAIDVQRPFGLLTDPEQTRRLAFRLPLWQCRSALECGLRVGRAFRRSRRDRRPSTFPTSRVPCPSIASISLAVGPSSLCFLSLIVRIAGLGPVVSQSQQARRLFHIHGKP